MEHIPDAYELEFEELLLTGVDRFQLRSIVMEIPTPR